MQHTEDVFILIILYNSRLNFYFVVLVVIGLVCHCCEPQPSVIIIIIIITANFAPPLQKIAGPGCFSTLPP